MDNQIIKYLAMTRIEMIKYIFESLLYCIPDVKKNQNQDINKINLIAEAEASDLDYNISLETKMYNQITLERNLLVYKEYSDVTKINKISESELNKKILEVAKKNNLTTEQMIKIVSSMNINPGEFYAPKQDWSLTNTLKLFHSGDFPLGPIADKSKHHCALYVRIMIEAGGLSTDVGLPKSYAWQYKDILPRLGFQCIKEIKSYAEADSWTSSQAHIGDICVIPGSNGENKISSPGHICMYTDTGKWVSDFIQDHMLVYRSYPYGLIYRYAGKMI